MRAGSMPESSTISAICDQIVGIQGMSIYGIQNPRTYNSDNRFFKLSLVVILLNRCTAFCNQNSKCHVDGAHFPPYFVNIRNIVSQRCPYTTIDTEYFVSTLSIYHYVHFVCDVFLGYCTSTHCLGHAHFKSGHYSQTPTPSI